MWGFLGTDTGSQEASSANMDGRRRNNKYKGLGESRQDRVRMPGWPKGLIGAAVRHGTRDVTGLDGQRLVGQC